MTWNEASRSTLVADKRSELDSGFDIGIMGEENPCKAKQAVNQGSIKES